MSVKFWILVALSFLMGGVFIVAGIFFLSQKFLDKLNDAAPVKSADAFKRNIVKAKGSGYIAIALGALTEFWAVLFILFPQILSALVLVYMIFLVAAFIVLNFSFR